MHSTKQGDAAFLVCVALGMSIGWLFWPGLGGLFGALIGLSVGLLVAGALSRRHYKR